MRGTIDRSNFDLENIFHGEENPVISDALLEKTLSDFFKYDTPYLNVQLIYDNKRKPIQQPQGLWSLEITLYMAQMLLRHINGVHRTPVSIPSDVKEPLDNMASICNDLFTGGITNFLYKHYCIEDIKLEVILIKKRMLELGVTEDRLTKLIVLNEKDIDVKLCGLQQSSIFSEEDKDIRSVDIANVMLEDSIRCYLRNNISTLEINNVSVDLIENVAHFLNKPENSKITNIQSILSSIGYTVGDRLLHPFLVVLDAFIWGKQFFPFQISEETKHIRENMMIDLIYNEVCFVGELMNKLNNLYTIENLVLVPEVLNEAISCIGDTEDTLHLQRLKAYMLDLPQHVREKYLCTYLVNFNR